MSKMKNMLLARTAPMIGHMPAYANSLTALLPSIYTAMDVVSRELVGFVPGVTRNASAERAAVGQTVSYPIAPAQQAYDIVPAMNVPEPPDNTFVTGTMAITKSRAVPWGFTGEEQRGLNQGGPTYGEAQAMVIAQALRTLTNEVELDLANEAALNASRAYGTAGTTPFGSGDLTDMAQIQKILDDNGAPASGRSMVLNTSAAARLQTIGNLSKVNESGTTMTLRDGELLDIYGMSVRKSGAAPRHVKSNAAGWSTTAAGFAVGAIDIVLSGGTGAFTQGDIVTFAGDTNQYVVQAWNAGTSTLTLSRPGLRVAIPAAATVVTVGNTYLANVAFSQDALAAAFRAPAVPTEGDLALDRMLVTDPRSGLVFEMSIWPGYRKVRGEVALAWGVKAVSRRHIALLLG